MSLSEPLLRVEGEVEQPLALTWQDLAALDPQYQTADVTQLGAKRPGGAAALAGILQLAGVKPEAKYLTLHASHDDFHASIPLDAVVARSVLIYSQSGGPLPVSAGGPIRFFIPDHTACHSSEIDECANVKHVDRLELSSTPGFDNRPADERQHAALHEKEQRGGNSV